LQTDLGKSGPGTQSRVLASGLRRLAGALRTSGAASLFLNQTRASEEGETSAGGPPLKLFAAARISLRGVGNRRIRFRVLKNKTAESFQEGDLRWENGVGFVERP
jgi:RecA/RadA recombinase